MFVKNFCASGSPPVIVKKAYYGKVGDEPKNERRPVAVKIVPRSYLEKLPRREPDDYVAYSHGDMRAPEDLLTEIGTYNFLNSMPPCDHIARMVDIFTAPYKANGREVEECVLVMMNWCEDGAVIDDLMNRGAYSGDKLTSYSRQLFTAVEHLHGLNIAHRDISCENMILSHDRRTLQLIDWGQAVLIRPHAGGDPLRYFRKCAKDMYRSPEQYIPSVIAREGCSPPFPNGPLKICYQRPGRFLEDVVQIGDLGVTENWATDYPFAEVYVEANVDIPAGMNEAQLSGYQVAPADIFACGASVVIMMVANYIWRNALMVDRGYAYIVDPGMFNGAQPSPDALPDDRPSPGLPRLLGNVPNITLPSDEAILLCRRMVGVRPRMRPSARECLDSQWLQP
jgi:serine/threonine protein kinase